MALSRTTKSARCPPRRHRGAHRGQPLGAAMPPPPPQGGCRPLPPTPGAEHECHDLTHPAVLAEPRRPIPSPDLRNVGPLLRVAGRAPRHQATSSGPRRSSTLIAFTLRDTYSAARSPCSEATPATIALLSCAFPKVCLTFSSVFRFSTRL